MSYTGEPDAENVHYTTCPLCEATCGLEITTRGRDILSIRGDADDVFSHGYICPKAYGLKELEADPDRLRQPMIRRSDSWHAITWDEAFDEIERRLTPILSNYGRDSVAVYLGNPTIHNLSGQLYNSVLLRMLGSKNIYSASTLDQMPKQISAGLMFGTMLSIPIPDIDSTDYLLILGANPLVSNGSLMTAPDMRGRLRRLRARGGKIVVIDPRRTRTAQEASEHYFIRPGTDAYLLLGMVETLFTEDLVHPGDLARHLNGLDEVRNLARPFGPEVVAPICGISASTIRKLARELATASRAAVYGRIGTCTQEFGTLTSWLVDVLNALTGNLDRPGGALFPRAAAGARNTQGAGGTGPGVRIGPKKSRVRGISQVYGELPTVCLAEEITTPGEGQVRALITVAGNPALSAPNGDRLCEALSQLEFMVSVDIYLNETTRYADLILPPPAALERSHYDVALYQLSIRNIAHFSPPIFSRRAEDPDEWEILLRLSRIIGGQGASVSVSALDDLVVEQMVAREVRSKGSPVEGRSAAELLEVLKSRHGPERLLDLLLRAGPYGDAFGARPGGLTLEHLEAHPHGLDLGPLEPRIPEVLRTPSGKVELAPAAIVADLTRLQEAMARVPEPLVLIGRRELRSNNSWGHNLPALVKGDDQCTLLVHPDDAERLGLCDSRVAEITSQTASARVPVQVTDTIMPGVVSLPHGWGHNQPGTLLSVAARHAGVNLNRLTSDTLVDPLSGNAILNAIPVSLKPCRDQPSEEMVPLSERARSETETYR
jgi:anaerobic selenocysteine-containing dehydrogenase